MSTHRRAMQRLALSERTWAHLEAGRHGLERAEALLIEAQVKLGLVPLSGQRAPRGLAARGGRAGGSGR